ncbi:MAG: hypothetical protein NT001_01375 [Candidatus Woesearchaeota archaeon]|nr:hypothetical protein [Candidatus Woesearchaeota archaeon]
MVFRTKEVTMQCVQKQISGELSIMDRKIRNSFSVIKEEFEDHLNAINENTQEIGSHYESVSELNRKIEKLNERMDQMSAMVKELSQERNSISLSSDEQRIFLSLYMNEGFTGFDDIVGATHFNPDHARNLIASMLDKGVRLVREINEGRLYFKLNPHFKARQLRENVVKINPDVIRKMENKVLEAFF